MQVAISAVSSSTDSISSSHLWTIRIRFNLVFCCKIGIQSQILSKSKTNPIFQMGAMISTYLTIMSNIESAQNVTSNWSRQEFLMNSGYILQRNKTYQNIVGNSEMHICLIFLHISVWSLSSLLISNHNLHTDYFTHWMIPPLFEFAIAIIVFIPLIIKLNDSEWVEVNQKTVWFSILS